MIKKVSYSKVKHQYKQVKSNLLWLKYYELLVKQVKSYYITYAYYYEVGFSLTEKKLNNAEIIGWKEIGIKDIDEIIN